LSVITEKWDRIAHIFPDRGLKAQRYYK